MTITAILFTNLENIQDYKGHPQSLLPTHASEEKMELGLKKKKALRNQFYQELNSHSSFYHRSDKLDATRKLARLRPLKAGRRHRRTLKLLRRACPGRRRNRDWRVRIPWRGFQRSLRWKSWCHGCYPWSPVTWRKASIPRCPPGRLRSIWGGCSEWFFALWECTGNRPVQRLTLRVRQFLLCLVSYLSGGLGRSLDYNLPLSNILWIWLHVKRCALKSLCSWSR